MKTKYIIPSQMQMSANASYATRVQGPNTDRRPKEHLPMLTSTVLGHYCGIVVVYTESGPTRLHGVSNDDMDDSPDTRQADKPDWKTSMRRYGAVITHAYLTLIIGIWYLPIPSITKVIYDAPVSKLICQIARLPSEGRSEAAYQEPQPWKRKALPLQSPMLYRPPINQISKT